MDGLLTTLISVLLAEMGDRTQILAAALAIRFRGDRAVLFGLALATLINCALSAVAGSVMDSWISEAPLRLFSALSYLFAGFGMLLWRRPVDVLPGWRTGAFLTSFLGLFILQLGDKSQFIILTQSAQSALWGFVLVGGWIGIMIACVPAIILQDRLAVIIPIKGIRLGGGILLLLWGLYLALGAFTLI